MPNEVKTDTDNFHIYQEPVTNGVGWICAFCQKPIHLEQDNIVHVRLGQEPWKLTNIKFDMDCFYTFYEALGIFVEVIDNLAPSVKGGKLN